MPEEWTICLTCNGKGERIVQEPDPNYSGYGMTRTVGQPCYVCNDYGRGERPGWKRVKTDPAPDQ